MKNLNKFRFVAVILAFSAMTLGIFFPAVSVIGVDVSEKFPAITKVQKPSVEEVDQKLDNISVYFEENRGQQDKRVKYFSRGGGTEMFLTATEAVYVVRSQESRVESRESKIDTLKNQTHDSRLSTLDSKAAAVYMRLVGANEEANFAPSEQLEHRTNYFKGNESDWRTEIPNYRRITAENIYDGVNMIWQGKEQGGIQYDFVVAPNANPNQIEWQIEGAENVSLDAEGGLVIETEAGVMKQSKPFTYQETDGIRQEIESGFVIEKSNIKNRTSQIKFALGEYDRAKPLTIDPTMNLAYSTFLGGANTEAGTAIEVNGDGNVYVTGYTFSTEFPTTAGTFDTTYNGTYDVFVTKLNAAGSGLLYSTFIGGNSDDLGYSIAVDSSGNTFLTGFTFDTATDYPTTAGVFNTTHNGNWDVFVTKLNSTGSSLLYSTFIGGSGQDEGFGITVDSSGNAFVTGFTLDDVTDYPTTGGAFDTTQNGGYDVFISKLNATGSSLVYSTFLGGSSTDAGFAVAVDSSGNAFVTGYSVDGATDYPTTVGAFDTTHNGNVDVIVTKLNAVGSSLVYSTFLGGSADDEGFYIVLDSAGNAFLTGFTVDSTTDFPTTAGAFDTTHNGFADTFVTKLNAAGSTLIYSTFLGGSNDSFGEGIRIDSSGNAFVTGYTNSPDYPAAAGGFDTSHNGDRDVFVTKLNAAGSSLVFSTFIGGNSDDRGFGIAVNSAGNTFVTGRTSGGTPVYPTTAAGFDTSHNGGFDVFVAKLGGGATPFDFDGDGKTDISIFRPAPGEWWYLKSSNGGNVAAQFGNSTDKITPADYTGDGKTDFAFWRGSTGSWFVLRSENFSAFFSFPFGISTDVPVPADYDGDGKADAAVFRESSLTWFINKSSGGTDIIGFGAAGDKPVVGDYDGDSKADIAIFRPNGANGAEWWIRRSSNQSVFALQFGASTDKPVQGDYTGDGKSDVAFWRPANGFWFILRSEDFSFFAFPFGATGDVPVAGDYDGDGKFDAAVFRPSSNTWFIQRSTAGTLIQTFGIAGDLPTPNAFVP